MADVLAAPVTDADAPVEVAPRAALPVIEGGLVTTVLTLAGLYWLAHNDVDFNPMGWYANYVIPAGAIVVGLVAGSGYGVMSWVRGVKIRRGLLACVVVLQLLAYAGAEYTAYLDVVHRVGIKAEREGDTFTPPGFFAYFHHKTENFAWKKKNSYDTETPLGHAGYFFVGLAALGFVGGGLIAPLIAMTQPYCEGCQRYMKTKQLGLIPASVPFRKIKKTAVDDLKLRSDQNDETAAAAAEGHAATLNGLATANNPAGFRTAAAAAFGPKKETNKLPVRLLTHLVHCPGCGRGWVRHTAVAGQGKQMKQTRLSQTEVAAEFTDGILRPPVA